MKLRCTGDRHDPGFLRKQPRERNLSRCYLLLFCNPANQINQSLICLSSLWSKARDDAAEVAAIEIRIRVDLPREESRAQRAERNEADSEFIEDRQNFCFGASPK